MTGRELQTELLKHGLTQREAANLFGYSERQISRWETGRYKVPKTVSALLAVAKHYRMTKDELFRLVDRCT